MNEQSFIVGLMKQGSNIEPNQLGFIPSTSIAKYIERGDYVIQHDNRGRMVGYVLHGSLRSQRIATIPQAIIEFDLRSRGHGYEAVSNIIQRATSIGCREIRLRCAEDLQAIEFWKAIGFLPTKIEYPANKRRRGIITLVYPLMAGLFDWKIFNDGG